MKKTVLNIVIAVIALMSFAFSLTGCYETHYYHHYNHHTRYWYDHRHMPPPAGVNFEVDIDRHHHH